MKQNTAIAILIVRLSGYKAAVSTGLTQKFSLTIKRLCSSSFLLLVVKYTMKQL